MSGPASGLARETRLVTAEGDRIVLAVDPEVRAICTEASREALQRAVGEALGRPVRIELREQGAEGAPNLAELLGAEDRRRRAQALAAAESDPLVEALRRDLDARLVPDSIVPE
ncbi:MAG: hypothetical protein RML12_06370 [Xanthomonadales bacterium]|nr:hypothetical protein [Xanthomonadales bacterium]